MTTEKVTIYCDGACSGNQYKTNTGGWGAILQYKDHIKQISGAEKNTTNQRMEITGCIKALEQLKPNGLQIEIYSDSAYLVNCINQGWHRTWQRNGWKNSAKKPVENRDLWEKLLQLLSQYKVTFHKVLGHSGDSLNEQADLLARKAIEEYRPG
jgi:ribonuclease HI